MTNTLHIYTRVSSLTQQEEGTSLENQKQLGIKKAHELGFDFRLWNEGGQSSFHDDFNNRPVLVSLLALIESGEVKHLFVYNTDRLSRNQQTWAVIRFKLLAHGVTLHTASGQMKLKNPVDDLMLGILSEISQYDNRIRAERSRLGRFHKVQLGNWKGGPPPFGYRLDGRRLAVDPFESEWVRRMFDWYCEGVSTKEIQTRLSRDGVLTRRSNAQWSLGSIQLILRNPVYAGYFDYTDKLVGETVRIQTPPLISPSLFQIAQDRRKQNRERSTPTKPTKHFYLLRGVIACGHCGTAMGGRTHKAGHQHVYYCTQKEKAWKTRGDDHQKWKRGSGCSMVRSVNIALTDQLVWKMVKETVQKLHERLPDAGDPQGSDHQDVGGEEGIQTDGITWMSPDQMDLVSDDDRRALITRVLTRVSVFFERETNRHLLKMQLSEPISRLLAGNGEHVPSDATAAVPEGGSFLGIGTCSGAGEVGTTLKKSRGSQGHLAAEHAYSVTVE